MSFLLCHECFTWIEPFGGRCPECQQSIDLATPDPPLHQLQRAMGQVLFRVGEVRVRRPMLPNHGILYATTNGLYFVPHRIERVTQMVQAESLGTSLFWSIAASLWAPLMFVLPFVKTQHMKATHVPVFRPEILTPRDSWRLPEMLMQNPGVFFVPKKAIRIVSRKRRSWRIERFHRPPLKLKPIARCSHFHGRMIDLLACDTWQDLMMNG